MKQHDQAIKDYCEAIRLEPNEAIAYFGRGIAYSDKGQYDHSINDFKEVIRLEPNLANIYARIIKQISHLDIDYIIQKVVYRQTSKLM